MGWITQYRILKAKIGTAPCMQIGFGMSLVISCKQTEDTVEIFKT